MSAPTRPQKKIRGRHLCCQGKCRNAAVQLMDRDQLVEALINAEAELDMAEAYIDQLVLTLEVIE